MSATLPTVAYPTSLSVEEVAVALNVVPLTVRRLIAAKKLKASRVGRRVIVRPSELDRFLEANPA
ncbi:helix-turn-helix domain-containing protein [Bradyrhizobium sp. USDA 4508]